MAALNEHGSQRGIMAAEGKAFELYTKTVVDFLLTKLGL